MTMTAGSYCVTTALVLAAMACRDEYTVDVGSGGAGGSPSGLAAAGGNSQAAGTAGMAGSAGSADELPDGGAVHFRALLQGERINFEASENAWYITCNDNIRVLQKLGDNWTPLRDERPTASNDILTAHYLDGALEPQCFDTVGCDVEACYFIDYDDQLTQPGEDISWLSAREYVRVGERQALTCDALDAVSAPDAGRLDAGSDADQQVVPEIESRAPTGPLIVRVRYYRDRQCQTAPLTADVVVE